MGEKLILNVKGKYFKEIASGEKEFEYRLFKEYWIKRLANIHKICYDGIIIKLGYPRDDEKEKILHRPWRGYEIIVLTHPELGVDPVRVFAIRVN
jgi:hypothetical protein